MTGPLKTWMVAAIAVAVLLIAGLPTLAVALASDDEGGSGGGSEVRHGQGDHRPPWAHRHGPARGPGSAWKSLSPAKKAEKMAELSRKHAVAMQKWADCVAAGRTDCVRPLPPGLAKKR